MKEIDAVSRQTEAMAATNVRMDEASLSRVYSHTQGTNIGIIASDRAELSPAERKSRNAELYSDIRSAGFGVIKIKCHYIEDCGTPGAQDVEEDFVSRDWQQGR